MTGGTGARPAPALAADGLLLRAWAPDDASAVFAMSQDPQARAWSGSMQRINAREDARDWVERRGSSRTEWAVVEAATGELVGRIGLHAVDLDARVAEIGYSVAAQRRRQGVATRAIGAVSAHGFGSLGLARIALVHAVGNPASCATATRSGFAYEGPERSAIDHGDGVRHDVHRHARLVGDPPGPAAPPGPSPEPLEAVVLAAGGLQLRPWQPSDADAVLVGLSDPLTARWNPRLPLRDTGAARDWIAGRTERWADGRAASWAVVEEAAVVGSVGLRDINHIDAFAVASYWTMPQARGRGIATAALDAGTRYAFAGLAMHRVQLGHAVPNAGSCRVAAKAGFELEGVLRGSTRLAAGWVDEHLHARLAPTPPVGSAR